MVTVIIVIALIIFPDAMSSDKSPRVGCSPSDWEEIYDQGFKSLPKDKKRKFLIDTYKLLREAGVEDRSQTGLQKMTEEVFKKLGLGEKISLLDVRNLYQRSQQYVNGGYKKIIRDAGDSPDQVYRNSYGLHKTDFDGLARNEKEQFLLNLYENLREAGVTDRSPTGLIGITQERLKELGLAGKVDIADVRNLYQRSQSFINGGYRKLIQNAGDSPEEIFRPHVKIYSSDFRKLSRSQKINSLIKTYKQLRDAGVTDRSSVGLNKITEEKLIELGLEGKISIEDVKRLYQRSSEYVPGGYRELIRMAGDISYRPNSAKARSFRSMRLNEKRTYLVSMYRSIIEKKPDISAEDLNTFTEQDLNSLGLADTYSLSEVKELPARSQTVFQNGFEELKALENGSQASPSLLFPQN